ncbi:minor tail protein [Microbacterium phage GardenState]|uniref:Minor tail protein n=1 Tax=Microbacterium phage GardenState TaxID=2776841 RepID=A0A7L8ZDE9_9CAUD|nr:minor tail protein [Microbacterium phage GardenState]
MNVSDIIVEVRDRDLNRVAQLTEADMDTLVAVPRDNDVGSWELRLPDSVLNETTGEWESHAAAQHLRKEGAGLIITAPGPDIPAVPPTYAPGDIVARNALPYTTPGTGWAWSLSATDASAVWLPGGGAELTHTGAAYSLIQTNSVVPFDAPTVTYVYDVRAHQDTEIMTWASFGGGTVGRVFARHTLAAGERTLIRATAANNGKGTSGVVQTAIGWHAPVPTSGIHASMTIYAAAMYVGTVPDAGIFSGDTPSDPPGRTGYAYSWEGTPNASPSIKREYTVTSPGTPAIPTFTTLLSGPMTSATFEASSDNLSGEWRFTGVSDTVLLADALSYPQPSNGDPTTQTATNDKRTGSAESLIRQYVAYNIASSHAPAARLVGLRQKLTLDGNDQLRGLAMTKSPRFQNLLELCQEIGFAGGVSFDIAQVGTGLKLRVWTPSDRSAFVRMDMRSDLLKSVSYGYGSPSTTVAVVAGQGQGTERAVVSRTSDDATAAEVAWGRRIERFVDQRSSEDVAELIQKGDETILDGGATVTGLQASPTDSSTMLYLRDWTVGDIVSVVVEGQEVKVPVSEVAVGVSGAAVTMVATLGEASAFDVDAASQRRTEETTSRVSAIERTLEVPASYATDWASIVGKPSTFPAAPQTVTIKPASALPPEWPKGFSITSTATGDGWPATYAVIVNMRESDVRHVQLVIEKTTGRAWLRSATSATSWGSFREVLVDSVPWEQITGKPSTFAPSAHSHAWGDITGTPSTFPPSTHTHSWSQITGAPQSIHGSVSPYGGWEAYPGLGPKFTLQPDGTVILSGLIRRTAAAFTASARSTYEFGLLGTSLRPAQAKYLPINTSIGLTEGIVQPSGVIMFRPFSNMSVGIGTFFSLDGITYNVNH